ncbi:MAG: prepilin-type N-terminal cleavage/methylation domain-containing protein, partial [Nitrospira sp.]|nr:prepilin-type N-terminal cleavage/methylation domain-containing protein [Nitrospira sp.]
SRLDMSQPSGTSRQAGFTVIELLIVMAILGALAGLAMPAYLGYLDKARIARCIVEIRSIERVVNAYEKVNGAYPNNLGEAGAGEMVDPWGNPYEYLNIAAFSLPGNNGNVGGGGHANGGGNKSGAWGWLLPDEAHAAGNGNSDKGKPRKDRFLHPINSDYDLYSKGKDGESVEPLTAKKSYDDVIRANDGSFVGLAADF